jgi:hypothetical protein
MSFERQDGCRAPGVDGLIVTVFQCISDEAKGPLAHIKRHLATWWGSTAVMSTLQIWSVRTIATSRKGTGGPCTPEVQGTI